MKYAYTKQIKGPHTRIPNSEVPLAVSMQLLVLPQGNQFALPHQEQYHTRACELGQVTELEHNVDHDRCVGDP